MNSNSTTIDNVNVDFQVFLEEASKQDDITWYIAKEALEYDDPKAFFNDLTRHGCISGMIGGLIYYTDTHTFFEKHYDEIQELKDELEESIWQSLDIQWDIKNFLAWFAVEEIAYTIVSSWEVF